jgi:uncharacterized protein YfaS (alpha-2-macroglobulin family)
LGCGDDSGSSSPEAQSTPPKDTTKQLDSTRVDQPRNGSVEVDEAGLHAQARASEIELTIPVRGLAQGSGEVIAELIAVDGSKVLSSTSVEYELGVDDEKTLTAQLRLPSDVAQQGDRAAYSVRVRDHKSDLRVTRSLLYVLTPFDLRFEGPASLRAERTGSYRVRALQMPARTPLVDQAVSIDLLRNGEITRTLQATTDDDGSAIVAIEVDEPGAYSLAVASEGEQLSGAINVRGSDQKILLTSDKPLYQPGQTIHMRALALQSPDNKPLAASKLLFEVSDGKGNKVFKRTRKTDDYGIASVDFKLASLVNMGSYKLQVSGAASAEKTVEVSHYVLPKFEVKVATERSWYTAGAEIKGTADARYFFGKLVSGADVMIEALTLDVGAQVFQRVMGKTDAQGRYAFAVELPEVLVGLPIQNNNALVTLRTTITDTAGQVVVKDTPITVSESVVQLSLVPEGTQIMPGLSNRFHLFATDPIGGPVSKAEVVIDGAGAAALTAETDEFGHAELEWTVSSDVARPVSVELTTHEGTTSSSNFYFTPQQGVEHVLVRTDKSLYSLGETAKVQVIGTRSETRAYVDWLNDGQIVDMRTIELKEGVASFEVTLDSGLSGENRIEAYVVDSSGSSIRAARTIVVQQEGALKVALSQDKSEYRPGEPAVLTFSVTDKAGKPAPAALGVQIVDEAVFGLIDARPGLLRTFFELEDAFAVPDYELHAPQVSFEKLLFDDVMADAPAQRMAAQAQAEAQLSALRGQRVMGLAVGTWDATLSHAQGRLAPFYAQESTRLSQLIKPVLPAALEALAAQGCTPQQTYCRSLSINFWGALSGALADRIQLNDFWGGGYRSSGTAYNSLAYLSAGPDELSGNHDDRQILVEASTLGLKTASASVPATSNAATFPAATAGAAGASAAAPSGGFMTPNAAEEADGAGPRVRSEFPETLYVNPALITDADGKASVSLDMADSITSWRVSSLANAQSGLLGGGQGAIKVFQDFFVDVVFPAELTRGDQIEFPIVVYNYLKTEQTVRLELEAASWFVATGSTSTSLTLAPDSVQSVKVPVRVEKVGAQTLTVRAFGSNASDAVARSVRVVPDGVQVPLAQSGSLQQGSSSLTVTVPANAIEGSAQLYLDVYPGLSSQAVQGLDSMLQVPSGCFEQTTSTTWPNVLVTRYLDQTKQNTPEITLKAESLISAGYQRLLTFEHRTGGFSWFGETDVAPDLSVTAFGLMEFADMGKVTELDPTLLSRTQTWLASQQEADGSFKAGVTEFFSFQTGALRNTAFTAWAFAESGYTGDALERALSYVRAQLESTPPSDLDTYTLALAANALASAVPDDPQLAETLRKIDDTKLQDGAKIHWASGTQQTNFYGGGHDADVSTTALVAHAMVRAKAYPSTARGALDYIVAAKDSQSNFGSTQATIWALKALMLAAGESGESAVGDLTVSVDGQTFKTVPLKKDEADLTTRVDLSSLASAGRHSVTLDFVGSGQVSYNLVSAHHVPWTAGGAQVGGPLELQVAYDRTSLAVDETVTANLTVRNLTSLSQSMLLVTVGLPPGFELQTDELDADVATGRISRYERTGKQLILYITRIEPSSSLVVEYSLRASMPVRAADGGSKVALYYQPDQKAESTSTTLVVTSN